MLKTEHLRIRSAGWITRTGRNERGLFCNTAQVIQGTFVATFGPVSRSTKHARKVGYQVEVRCRIPGRHSAFTLLVTPAPDWEERGYMGPMINHTCCVKHVNCEYVSSDVDEDGQQTVMVRTTRDVCMGEEFLAHFGERFTTVLSEGCECCACTRATAGCRKSGIQARV
jgi:hypothetical protein